MGVAFLWKIKLSMACYIFIVSMLAMHLFHMNFVGRKRDAGGDLKKV